MALLAPKNDFFDADNGTTYSILTNATSTATAYAMARVAPRVIVSPQVTLGSGLVVGIKYLFQIVGADAENVSWKVTKMPSFIGLGAGGVSTVNVAEKMVNAIEMSSGKTRTFSFCPKTPGRYTISVSFSKPDVAFQDQFALQVAANGATDSFRDIFLSVVAFLLLVGLVIATAIVCFALLRRPKSMTVVPPARVPAPKIVHRPVTTKEHHRAPSFIKPPPIRRMDPYTAPLTAPTTIFTSRPPAHTPTTHSIKHPVSGARSTYKMGCKSC